MKARDPLIDPELRGEKTDVDVLIVGAGISGIGMGIALRQQGWNSFVLLEAAQDIGGTWRDNTYPGVAVDIPSSSYSYSFETDFPWSRVFAPGSEVQSYIRHCVEKYGIGRHIRYGSKVAAARFDTDHDLWHVKLQSGEEVTARVLVAATGLFGAPVMPEIPGLDQFTGKTMHTARWDHAHDVSGHRVAIIGTGASAVQIVPKLAGCVEKLTVFQRTPIYVAPRLDFPLGTGGVRRFGFVRKGLRFTSELGVGALTFVAVNYRRFPFLTKSIQRIVRRWMRRQVEDPATAQLLCPDYDLGCKRPATSNTYLASFNQDNVALVTSPISHITQDAVVCENGTEHEIDTLVLATGYLTTQKGNNPTFEIFGRDGRELGAFWDAERLQSYAGIAVDGFPNFFLTAGPYGGGLNWFTMLETHVAQIMSCLAEARKVGATRIEVEAASYGKYVNQARQRAEGTVFKAGQCSAAHSYYIDRHGDAALPSPFTPAYRAKWARRKGSRDFQFSAATDRGAS